MNVISRSVNFSFLFFGISFALVAVLFVALPTPVHAGPQTGGCGESWGYEYTVVVNPYTPFTPAHDAWHSLHGGDSYTVQSAYQIASVGDEGCPVSDPPYIAPTVGVVVVPLTITAGESSQLAWGAENTLSCTGTNFSTGSATQGVVTVSPTVTTTYSVSCTDGATTVSSSATLFVNPPPVPTASLSASTNSIVSGSPSTLTWNSTNATSCAGTNFSTGGATAGSVSVSPVSSTSYLVSCTGLSGSASASVTVTVTPPVLQASCSVSSTSAIVGQAVTWTAVPSGGTGSYTYSWSGSDSLSGTGSSVSKSYSSTGTKTGSVSVTSGSQTTSVTCSNSVSISNAPVAVSCSVSPTSATVGSSATWSASASGGTGSYTYSWTGTDSLSGTGASVSKTYSTTGTKTGSVTATSGGQSATANCSNSVVVSNTPVTGSCSVSPSSQTTGSAVTWSASASGGTGSYSYVWSGTDSLSGSASSVSKTYSSTGTKSGSVIITSGGNSTSVTCANSVSVSYPAITGSCSVSPTTITAGGSATWSASASGGSGSYTYSWSGTDSLSGTGTSVTKTYSSSGAKTASITITSGGSSEVINCSNALTVGNVPVGGSCSVTPTSMYAGSSATWTAVPSGGTGSYTYVWSGTDSLSGTASSVSKTYSGSGIKTGSVAITSGGNSATVTCSNSVAVSVTLSDLITGAVSPTSAVAGVAQMFSATITNIGQSGTNGAFTSLFQRATSAGGANTTDIGTDGSPSVSANGTDVAGLSYAFPSGGIWYLRVWADKSGTADSGAINESSESNNSGAWTAISVSSPTLSAYCNVAPASGYSGDTFTWTAYPSGGTGSYTYSWTGSDGLSGTTQSVAKSYSTSGTKTGSVTVVSGGQSVGATCASANLSNVPSALITATPNSIILGNTSRLDWTSSNASSCNSSAFSTGGAPSGSVTVTPLTTKTYDLTCTDGTRTGVSSATVTVVPVGLTLSINPSTTVRQGDPATVNWSVSGSPDSCSIQGPGLSSTALSGSRVVTITAESTYVLTCTSGGSSITTSVTIGLTPHFEEF
ncbi:MAG: hypothetical protein V4449_01140 [Patescibacteria group bacterium]